tara:strand:+ start:459 stop:1094 length:636 start_codon:yes stop_codon:yes gene_type:complete
MIEGKKNIVIFASGTGSNFVSIYNHIDKGSINARIALLISNSPNCGAIKFANSNNISTSIIKKDMLKDSSKYEDFLLEEILKVEADLIVLAGFLKIIPKEVIAKYEKKILNIHPSLLPKFGGKGYYGDKVHKAVIESGEDFTGATVHFVNAKYDEGPIVFQKKVKVNFDDDVNTISKKVLKIEHEILPFTVKAFCENKISWKDNKPLIIGS